VEEIIDCPIVSTRAHSIEQEEFISCTKLRQVIKAGRRFGKTVGSAIKALEAFMGICPKCHGDKCLFCDNTGWVEPRRVLYAAPVAEQVTKFWYEITSALSEATDKGYLKKDETEKYIERPGTELRLQARTAWNANTLRGGYWGLLILEEYQLMNEDTWEEVGQPMLLDTNGTAVFIYTPPSLKSEGVSKAKDPRHASKMYKKADADESGRWQTFHFTSYQNPTLSQEALGEISKDMTNDAYRREILAEDDEVEASWMVYGKFNESVCKIKRFEVPTVWPVISGHDFGSANPAALFLAKVKLPLPDGAPPYMRYGDYVLWKEYAPGGGFSTTQHIEKFKEITTRYSVEQSVGGNLTTEGEIRQSYGSNGWPISAPALSRVNAQIDKVIGLMELNKLFIFDDMFGLLSQIYNCLWELDIESKPINRIKNESRYHYLACLRYLATYLPAERIPRVQEVDKIKVGTW